MALRERDGKGEGSLGAICGGPDENWYISLDHVAGNRAGQAGLRDSRGQSQQNLVADYGVKANSQLPDLDNLVIAMPFPGVL